MGNISIQLSSLKKLIVLILLAGIFNSYLHAQSVAAYNNGAGSSTRKNYAQRSVSGGLDSIVELGTIDTITYACSGNKLYTRKKKAEAWNLFTTLPFSTNVFWACGILDKAIAYRVTDDSIALFHPGNAITTYTTVSAMLGAFLQQGISGICIYIKRNIFTASSFPKGPKWCYTKQGSRFVPADSYLKELLVIDSAAVDSIVAVIPHTLSWGTSLNTWGLTQAHYQQCRREIIQLRDSVRAKMPVMNNAFQLDSVEYVDFDKLLSMVDSVKTIDEASLNYNLLTFNVGDVNALSQVEVEFTNKQGQVVSVSYTGRPSGAFYSIWSCTINNFSWWLTACMPFEPFIAEIEPEFFCPVESAKAELLRHLVRCRYYYYR